MGGIDIQDDCYEGCVWVFGFGEEVWFVYCFILIGDLVSEELWCKVGLEIYWQFICVDGVLMCVECWCWDVGGYYVDEVEVESIKYGVYWVVLIFGVSIYGKLIVNFLKCCKCKVYKIELGIDNVKELIYSCLCIDVFILW